MTNERPLEDARCWFMNTSDRTVDIYVNYHETPLLSITPTEDQGAFTVDSDASGVYGTYTFEAREKDDPDDEPLASASVMFEEHDSYTAVFRQTGDADYELSIYENDFTPSANTRFEIRHTGVPETIDWRLFPKDEADPSIPVDERSGTLERGQWQQALDVIENEYRLEIIVDGKVIAFRQDLELELNRMIVVHLHDDPQWWYGSDRKEDHIFRQEFQIQTGPQREDIVTPPAEPVSSTDQNQTIEFDCSPLELYHTNHTQTEVAATDPDGIVSDIRVDSVEPYSDGFKIPDESVDRAWAIGDATTATLDVRPKVPPASYDVTLLANPNGLGERVTCTLPVTVKRITIQRLHDLTDRYYEAGEMNAWMKNELHDLLDDAAVHLDAGDHSEACNSLKDVITVVGEYKDQRITPPATVDFETETKALRKRLGCG